MVIFVFRKKNSLLPEIPKLLELKCYVVEFTKNNIQLQVEICFYIL